MTTDVVADVMAALRQLSMALEKHGMRPPRAVLLDSDKDWDQLAYSLLDRSREKITPMRPITADMKIYGIRISTPTKEARHEDQN